jgi:hypothetical protein
MLDRAKAFHALDRAATEMDGAADLFAENLRA